MFLLMRDRDGAMAELQERAEDQTLLLSEHAARLFDAAELSLATVVEDTRGMAPAAVQRAHDLHTRIRRLADRLPYVEAFWLNGPEGRLWLTSLTFPAPPVDALGMDFFTVHQESPDVGVYVSHTVIGRTNRPTFRLSRRLESPQGNINGVASLTVEVGFFRDFYRRLPLPAGSVVRLLRSSDLAPLIEEPAGGAEATPLERSEFASVLADQPQAGLYSSVGSQGETWINAYRAVPDFPLYQVVSVRQTAVEEWWRPRLRLRLAEGAAALAALTLLTWAGLRQARGQREFQAKLEERVAVRTAALEAANRDLGTLVQEVHHRVRNNLQIVSNLLTLQAARISEPAAAAALAESIGRVHTIALVHQTLYDDGAMVALRLHRYLQQLAIDGADLYPETRLIITLEADEVAVPLETAVPLALIIHEVLSNAVRHGGSGREREKVCIGLKRDGDLLRLTIADDGAGLPTGFAWGDAANLGLTLVRALADQIGGQADLVTDGGTRFTLTWKA